MHEKHQYLLRIEFLGFRFSGWQRQPGEKTVEEMLLKTLRFVLPGRKYKLLGAGRTDARVSARDFGLQLLITGIPLDPESGFMEEMNRNLPQDIRLSSVQRVPLTFNVIRDCTRKVYRYYFAFGEKPHPFCAPLLGYFPGPLDMETMEKGARCFEGDHDFRAFTGSPARDAITKRRVQECRIHRNHDLSASFFPEESYCLTVSGKGFGRYQVRRMMAALVALGRGVLPEADLIVSLKTGGPVDLKEIAPASGLQLIHVEFSIDP
ncbi:MAG: tRNA pseudouridine(38-40) synthase TruA [Robiginitalea sp.]